LEASGTQVFSLRIREADCDPYGHVRTASYLTFIHEARAGTRLETEPGWTARRSYLEYYVPLLPADQAEVKSWATFAESHGEVRLYEIRKSGASDLSARGTVEWIRLDEADLAPSQTLPASNIMPNAVDPDSAPGAIQFPEAPPPPAGAFTHSRQVAWCELGLDSRLTPAACLEYMIECAIQAGKAHGWTFEDSQQHSLAFVVRKQWLETFDLPGPGVQVSIDTWLSDVKRATCIRHYAVRRVSDGVRVARGHTLWVCVDPVTGAPVRIPANFLEDFRPHIAG
jgi:acyl-CoA thioesterase FadM